MNVTTREFNQDVCPKISHASAFLHSLDHALEKGESAETRRQVQIAGWGEEVRDTLLDALDAYYLAQKQLIEQAL